MKVLCACEESQVVCIAFRALGHEAYSCDIQEPSGGHPEWHILGDALKAIEGGQVTTMDGHVHDVGRWDMIIAFPPCTKTSNAGARHLYKGGRLNLRRYYEGLCGKALFFVEFSSEASASHALLFVEFIPKPLGSALLSVVFCPKTSSGALFSVGFRLKSKTKPLPEPWRSFFSISLPIK